MNRTCLGGDMARGKIVGSDTSRWCGRGESNPHGLVGHKLLRLTRLPVPPLPHRNQIDDSAVAIIVTSPFRVNHQSRGPPRAEPRKRPPRPAVNPLSARPEGTGSLREEEKDRSGFAGVSLTGWRGDSYPHAGLKSRSFSTDLTNRLFDVS